MPPERKRLPGFHEDGGPGQQLSGRCAPPVQQRHEEQDQQLRPEAGRGMQEIAVQLRREALAAVLVVPGQGRADCPGVALQPLDGLGLDLAAALKVRTVGVRKRRSQDQGAQQEKERQDQHRIQPVRQKPLEQVGLGIRLQLNAPASDQDLHISRSSCRWRSNRRRRPRCRRPGARAPPSSLRRR